MLANLLKPTHLLLILLVVLIVFGPSRLPQLGSALGKAIQGFKKGIQGSDSGKGN